MICTALLPARGVIEIDGDDRVAFLQGLVSNDVALAAPGRAVWAALLTPQGKWLADFFILSDGASLLLDVERAQVDMLVQRLTRFRLRARVALSDLSGRLHVHVAWGGFPAGLAGMVAAPDPRLPEAGWRILSPGPLVANATAEAWDAHRLELGLPDGSADLESEKTVLLEAGFDELHGVSWDKGCYLGQELTARTKYRGLVKRRLVPVAIHGPLPPWGMPITRDGVEVGAMRSGRAGQGIALLRLEAIGATNLPCDGAALTPRRPAWMVLPEAAA
jgi:folate-binding protein YgfZ